MYVIHYSFSAGYPEPIALILDKFNPMCIQGIHIGHASTVGVQICPSIFTQKLGRTYRFFAVSKTMSLLWISSLTVVCVGAAGMM